MSARTRRWHWEGGRWSPPRRPKSRPSAAFGVRDDFPAQSTAPTFEETLQAILAEARAWREAKRKPA